MKRLTTIFLFAWSSTLSAQNVAKQLTASNGEKIGFYQSGPSDNMKHPLIIFLHGVGERGNGTTELPLIEYYGIPSITKNGLLKSGNTSFIVLSPQLSKGYGSWPDFIVDEMVKYARTLNIDTTQMYLTGLSLGGAEVIQYPIVRPGVFTALAAMAPACLYDYQKTRTITEPLWCFVGDRDEVVNPLCTYQLNGMVKNYKQTVYPGGNHGTSWTLGYADPNLYAWLLNFRKIVVGPVTPDPIEPEQPILDTGKTIQWIPIGGTFLIDKDNQLINGTYQVELRISQGANIYRDTVTVTIADSQEERECNIKPHADAGPDQVIKLGAVPTLKGSGSDPDGKIVGYKWKRISGPRNGSITYSTRASTPIKSPAVGVYVFELTVTDDKNATAADTMTLTINK